MSRPTPAQESDLRNLPWSTDMPDQAGYWWFTHGDGGWAFVEQVSGYDLEDLADEGRFSLCTLDISRMTRERWAEGGWRCCPLVLSA